jgi:hypothetical protein
MAVMDEVNKKYGPIPLWGYGVGAALIAGYIIIKRKNAAASDNQDSTQAAADQTNSNLGSASELANMFEVAGLMPYQGGDTYVNVSVPSGGTGTSTTTTSSGGTSTGTVTKSGTPAYPIPPTPVPPKTTTGSTPVSTVKSYTVKSGDTLIGVASKQFGLPATEAGADKVYDYDGNTSTIQNQAKAHGHTSDYQHWLYPGETLKYPVVG